MPLRNARPLTIQPAGVSDALDGTNAFPGAMSALTNLVPDPTTDRVWVPRPAATQISGFPGSLNTPGFISGLLVVGNIAYGTIATAKNAGKDEPFAFNMSSGTLLTVNGITNANSPTSPTTSGDWTPPIIAQVASRILVTHPGFPGSGTKFGWFDISGFSSNTITGNTNTSTTVNNLSANVIAAGWQVGMTITDSAADIPAGTTIVSIASNGLSLVMSAAATAANVGTTFTVAGGTAAAPLWAAGDTNLNNLPSVPVGVAQFNGRAYFACGVNGVPFTDSLNPCQRTNASQALTTNDGIAVTALGPLPLSSPITGGIAQAIVAFQGAVKMQIITGDSATSNLAINAAPVATGTLAPLTIQPTELGLAFVSPHGLRFVTFTAMVTPPVGEYGKGVSAPFIFAQNPSRMCLAANARVVRISVKNASAAGSPTQDYWYDVTKSMWSGPHNFPAGAIQPWGATFALAASGVNAKLFQSDVDTSSTSVYTENGTGLSWSYTTTLLPDNAETAMNAVLDTTLSLSVGASSITVIASDDSGNVLDTVSVASGSAASPWDSFKWDVGVWDAGSSQLRQRAINWSKTLVFKQLQVMVSGGSIAGVRVGNLYLKYQILGYKLQGT